MANVHDSLLDLALETLAVIANAKEVSRGTEAAQLLGDVSTWVEVRALREATLAERVRGSAVASASQQDRIRSACHGDYQPSLAGAIANPAMVDVFVDFHRALAGASGAGASGAGASGAGASGAGASGAPASGAPASGAPEVKEEEEERPAKRPRHEVVELE